MQSVFLFFVKKSSFFSNKLIFALQTLDKTFIFMYNRFNKFILYI